ncbi:MAG: type II toxin-antitoxin system HicB family antitoxin [Desulfovibrio sp.]|nr:type II toxin-antitoxin system HicB family antitoxin [Desulfovibrio sp.]
MSINNTMTYKGYKAVISFSAEDECLVGHIAGINDIVGFHGESVEEIRQAFEEAVDFYLESCEKMGVNPNKPYSGHITLRLPPDLHAELAVLAQANGSSLNGWLVSTLSRIIREQPAL